MYQRDYNNIRRHVANLRYEQACDKHPVLNFIAVASMIATAVLSIMVTIRRDGQGGNRRGEYVRLGVFRRISSC